MAGITWGICSTTATRFFRLTMASAAWIPIRPAPTTTTFRRAAKARSMAMASLRVMQEKTPRSRIPLIGGITAEDPLATKSVSYLSVFRLDSFTTGFWGPRGRRLHLPTA